MAERGGGGTKKRGNLMFCADFDDGKGLRASDNSDPELCSAVAPLVQADWRDEVALIPLKDAPQPDEG